MRFGVVYPQTEYPTDPSAIKDYAQATEELGYHHLLAYDHVLGANPERPGGWSGPYTIDHPFMEPFTLFSYMAAFTLKLEFTTGILILPQRQTALVAKQAAVLDILSKGRLRLGIGLGWNAVEYESLNQNFKNRGERIEEQVEVLRRLWTEPLLKFTGRWHHIPDAGLKPLPVQRPIPIWFGGHHENVLRRVAKMGDGWMPNSRRVAEAQPMLNKLDGFLQKEGRSRKDLGIEVRLQYGQGNPDEWKKTLSEWQGEGVTHVSINTMSYGLETPRAHIDAIALFAKEMGISAT